VALLGEGFSVDSFAMPYLWAMAGLIAATGYLYRQGVYERTVYEKDLSADTAD
jgi:hypothetical protein